MPDLPLNILPLPDGRHALVATSGYNAHELALVDLESKTVVDRQAVRESWFGLAASPDFARIWWSGGGGERRPPVPARGGQADPRRARSPRATATAEAQRGRTHFRSGLALDRRARSSTRWTSTTGRSRPSTSRTTRRSSRPRPGPGPTTWRSPATGTSSTSPTGPGGRCCVLDPADLRTTARIAVGEHPNQIAVHPKDDRLFVACASSNCVSVIDTRRGIVTETIAHGPLPAGPRGMHARRPGRRPRRQDPLRRQRRQQLRGRRSTSQRPAGARSRDSSPPAGIRRPSPSRPTARRLLVGVGKGNQTRPNPINVDAAKAQGRVRAGRQADEPCRSPTSAPRSRARSRSCRFPTRRRWPPTPRRSTGTAPTPTSS